MTVLSKMSAMASIGSTAVADPGQGCAGPDLGQRRDSVRSFHQGELHKRRRKKNHPKKEEDYRFRIGTMNVGTMRGRSAEVVETADRRRLDIGFLQETRWKGVQCPSQSRTQVRWLKGKDSAYKVFWSGNPDGTNGVGILLAKKWVDKVFEVQRPTDRIILLKLIIGKQVYSFVCGYAPQQGRPEAEKQQFYDDAHSISAKIPPSEVLVPGGDLNGHVGRSADGYEEVHGGFGFGERNDEGGRILDFAVAHDLVVVNTLFKKRDSHLITYASGGHTTQVDYILFPRRLRKLIRDVKVIPGEECLTQHRLLVCDLKIAALPKAKRKFAPRLRLWKLRDPECAAEFETRFQEKCESGPFADGTEQSSEEIWGNLKDNLNSAAEEVCGYSKNHQWRKETWFWNDTVSEAVGEKRKCYKVMKSFEKQKLFNEAWKLAKAAYKAAKKRSKRTVWLAKQDYSKSEYANVDPKGPEIHRLAKQMRRQNQDVCGEMPVRNNQGELCLDESDRMKAWVEHYRGLLNVEFPWDESALPEAPPVEGPPPPITDEMVVKALGKMKAGKAAGPSGIVVEMLKSAGSKGIEYLRELIIAVVKNGKIPEDWEMSYILNLYKGKGDALNRGNYRGLKLTEHVMKIMERVVDEMIREMVEIDEMQFAFVPGRGTTDAIFIIRQLQEKFLHLKDSSGKNLTLYFAFVDLEKAFDRVPRKVLWWAMRKVGVDEWIVRLVQAMYNNARSRVRVGSEYSEEFEVGVGVHQGSVLSPLLFIIVLEALSMEFRVGVPWELFFADDLVIIATSLEECVARVEAWKEGMESKGLHMNMTKTKIMASGLDLDVLRDSGKFPCAVCRTGVGERAAIMCSTCNHWVHKKCCGLKAISVNIDPTYKCPRCCGAPGVRPIDGRPFKEVEVGDSVLEAVDRFCYLGDMLSAGGGCEAAAIARCKSAWGKFRADLPLLTARALPSKVRGRLYGSNVRNSMLHGVETWPMTSAALHRLCRNDRAMIRWMCRVKPSDDIPMDELHAKLGIDDLTVLVRQHRLRWYGHVMRSSGEINRVRTRHVSGKKGPGRPKKTWEECVKTDLKAWGLTAEMTQDRAMWKSSVRNGLLERTPPSGSAPQSLAQPVLGMRTRSSINKKTGFD